MKASRQPSDCSCLSSRQGHSPSQAPRGTQARRLGAESCTSRRRAGLPRPRGEHCTIRWSNLNVIMGGSNVVYAQAADFGTGVLDSDLVIDGPGNNTAFGHVVPHLVTLSGSIVFSGGTGVFSGFHGSVAVTYSTGDNLWHWDGTYYFVPPAPTASRFARPLSPQRQAGLVSQPSLTKSSCTSLDESSARRRLGIVARMARISVRSGSLERSAAVGFRSTTAVYRTDANWRERCPESTSWGHCSSPVPPIGNPRWPGVSFSCSSWNPTYASVKNTTTVPARVAAPSPSSENATFGCKEEGNRG